MTGALFANDKGGNSARPDWRGDITIGGTRYRLAAWQRQGRKGTFLSLKADLPPPTEGEAGAAKGAYERRRAGPPANDLHDDIPF